MENIRLSVNINSFKYPDGTQALSEIKLEIKKGEFVGILGANGSGKTTLLKTVDGLIKDFEGSVHLDGIDIKKLSPKKIYNKVGLVFQNPDEQLFASTVFEDVAFGPINMGFKEDEITRRVTNALKNVEMTGYANKSIHNLSFGQKKRICIAGLLAMGHEILLLDEPTAGLDPMGVHSIMELLRNLNKTKNITIVMTTHSVDLVPLFLDRVIILSNGKIILEGTPKKVFSEPELIRDAKLRLPRIGHLFEILKKHDGFSTDTVPLTIGEAREFIKNLTATTERQVLR